ncbi:MAG: MFS transporter [Telmatospirillum sp.]|nr:MFS transporter [Telmatospirillum sp.]
MSSTNSSATRLATRLSFLVAGFGVACWAPLVPFAKDRLAVDDGGLGALLLCLGVGSVVAMVLTGGLSARYGSRPVIVAGGFGVAVVLPLLTVAATPLSLGAALFLFGAMLGSLDVAMNVHALAVERSAGRPMMSAFHALYSVGGFAGSAVMTILLSAHVPILAAAVICMLPMILAMAVARTRLLSIAGGGRGPMFVRPRGIVLVLALLTAVAFLVEGAVLDWSALLLTGAGLVGEAGGGAGFMVFSIAMTAGRFGGDALTARIGDRAVLRWGGAVAVLGLIVLLLAPAAWVAMAGFLLIGIGASNIVPVLFRGAGRQTAMPSGLAIAAISITGYAGILIGPAGIGAVAQSVGLPAAFAGLAALMGLVPVCARLVTGHDSDA